MKIKKKIGEDFFPAVINEMEVRGVRVTERKIIYVNVLE